jgi:hypothetical protein
MKCPPFGVMVEYARVKAAPAAGRDVWVQAKAAEKTSFPTFSPISFGSLERSPIGAQPRVPKSLTP